MLSEFGRPQTEFLCHLKAVLTEIKDILAVISVDGVQQILPAVFEPICLDIAADRSSRLDLVICPAQCGLGAMPGTCCPTEFPGNLASFPGNRAINVP